MQRHIPHENGAHYLVCSCGARVETGRSGGTAGGRLPPEALVRFFTNKGWKVGSSDRKDRCPQCQHRKPARQMQPVDLGAPAPKRQALRLVTSEPVVKAPIPTIAKEETAMPSQNARKSTPELQPAQTQSVGKLGREERRLIFAQLEEVYIDERTGYRSGWNDAKVAEHMKVPVEWVAEVREPNFGANKTDAGPEVQVLIEALAHATETIEDQKSELEALAATVSEQAKQISTLLARFKDQAATVNALSNNVRKITSVAA